MKTIRIPDWLYKHFLRYKNQYCLNNNLTLNTKAISKYKELTKGKLGKKRFEVLMKWLRAKDYTPEIPIDFLTQVFYESFSELGVAKKYRGASSLDEFLDNAESFWKEIGKGKSQNYGKLIILQKRYKDYIAKMVLGDISGKFMP